MIIEFLDESQLEVKEIFGGPRVINGVQRDTLSITIDASTTTFDDLINIFSKDTQKLGTIYHYKIDEEGEEKRVPLGEGYKIFVSVSYESRKVITPPGKLVPSTYEMVYIVTIAQQTYEEFYGNTPNQE